MSTFIKSYKKDPFVGHLSTPITTSYATRAILKNLPAYRYNLSSFMRGLEIGMAHGYFFVGPFTLLGPLRNSELANYSGFFSAMGLICILGLALALYGYVSFDDSEKNDNFLTKKGWNTFVEGFMLGASGGAIFAFLLLSY
jgi:photosystem I subunit XI